MWKSIDSEPVLTAIARALVGIPAALSNDLYRAHPVPSSPGIALVDDRRRVVDYAISLESARSLMRQPAALVTEAPALR